MTRGSGGKVKITLAAFAILAASAHAQVAERPEVRVGDRWQYVEYDTAPSREPNRERVIRSVGADVITGTENGEDLRLTPELNVIESWRERSANPRLLQFPLAVGKRWGYSNDWHQKLTGSKGGSDVQVEVLAFEPVEVPAGRFDAFKLRAQSTLRGTSAKGNRMDGVVTTLTYWYSPAARSIVKHVSDNIYLGRTTRELVSFQPGP